MNRDEYLALLADSRKKKSKNKFHAHRADGYASDKERRRAFELQALQRKGLVSQLREQVRYEVIPNQYDERGNLIEHSCCYIADFVYLDEHGMLVVEDVKGCKTKEYIIKRKLMLHVHGIVIKET